MSIPTQTLTPGSRFWNEKYRLAALSRHEITKVSMVALMVGIGYVMFHFLGNTTDLTTYGRSSLLWMVKRWQDSGVQFGGVTDYSFAWLIPPVSLFALWMNRKRIMLANKNVSRVGMALLVAALLLHWFGAKAQHPRLSLLALIGVLWSVPFYLYGWNVAKYLLFPCSYLIFCVPLNFLDDLSHPLRIVSSSGAVAILNGMGIDVVRYGTEIRSTGWDPHAAAGFRFGVDDPCSGLRSLLALTALTAAYAYLTQRTVVKKWILFLSAFPLAVIGNMVRVVSIALVAGTFGQRYAMVYHDFSGFIVFIVAIGLMITLGNFLERDFAEVKKSWKNNLQDLTSSSSA